MTNTRQNASKSPCFGQDMLYGEEKLWLKSHDDLCACLAAIPPVELLGMTLLRQGSPQLLPPDIPRDTLREAVTELVAYTGRCVAAANRLSNLAPVPLLHVVIPEFGL